MTRKGKGLPKRRLRIRNKKRFKVSGIPSCELKEGDTIYIPDLDGE